MAKVKKIQHEDMTEATAHVKGASARMQNEAEVGFVEYKKMFEIAFDKSYDKSLDIFDEGLFITNVNDIPVDTWAKRIIFYHLLAK